MKDLLERFKATLEQNPVTPCPEDSDSFLEFLWWTYSEDHPIQDENTKSLHQAMRKLMTSLSPVEQERMTDLLNQLCSDYERLAFVAGAKVGAQLMLELQK